MHGTVFASYTPWLQKDVRFIKGFDKQTRYQSSDKVVRTFCSKCGSNILFKFAFQNQTVWITPSSFDEEKSSPKAKDWWLKVKKIHIYCDDKVEWYNIPDDGAPRYVTEPEYNWSKL